MRGKVIVPHWRFLVNRITPAHAGKRLFILYHHYILWDHPRTCGEKVERHVRQQLKKGSPPHMRGKVKKHPFFPACQQDHPRTCGEKPFHLGGKCCIRGSPPHMRGKDVIVVFHEPLRRITPAHAGKRLKRSRSIVPHAAIVPLFPSVCNKPAGSDGSPAGHDAPPFLPIENAAPASPAYNLRSL